MTNTYIEAGEISYDDLLDELGDGILVKGSRGGMGGENFTFSAEMGYYIEDGKITKPIKNFTLTGNLFETLKNIRYCSDNVELFSTSGGCGKREQMPLPVGFGGPYVMVENALIGGR
jgi:TldD protein